MCHAISQSFYENYNKTKYGDAFPLNITIGNVYYKGKNIYNTNQDKIRSIIHGGRQLDKDLGVHVWLTLENMTVIDLTVLPTLSKKKLFKLKSKSNGILIWREDVKSNFYYEPLLVDNKFMHRVDKAYGTI